MKTFSCLKTKVSATNLEDVTSFFISNLDKAKDNYICCANAHTTVVAYENDDYCNVLNNAFIVLPDGAPVARTGIRKGYSEVNKVSGADFFEQIIKTTENRSINHFFYGNSKENLDKLISYLRENYTYLKIVGYEPSKFRDLSNEEICELKNKIKQSKADIVWVALGAPKQEFFCVNMCKDSNACWIAVGGAFNTIANIIPRAPKWMQNHSLEWFYRFIKEPKRLFKRYFIGNIKFIWYSLTKGR